MLQVSILNCIILCCFFFLILCTFDAHNYLRIITEPLVCICLLFARVYNSLHSLSTSLCSHPLRARSVSDDKLWDRVKEHILGRFRQACSSLPASGYCSLLITDLNSVHAYAPVCMSPLKTYTCIQICTQKYTETHFLMAIIKMCGPKMPCLLCGLFTSSCCRDVWVVYE